ncbi:RagB/SusD family nutrient uptake outer membrane protein [Mucilaginibacter pallidiroseus]|uniref:RagB/SusD family nutrient uptake outer membrane protein n=1 Tax=Mucilaginibacter pallidiroseus TaxID=2599295 RepID=A0A563TZK5_9SPHI|nr:RagB/SusD family nutrient uptake outer membrane protein [Mucilaginibacter pallidiroseus]TWR24814.1 RagB/SusD family nutrient uptake outer membrane protein [Mucilaginibacter pallidiroseus]
MKKLYILISFGLACLTLFSCKKEGFLGQTQTTDLTQDKVFKDSVNTMAFLTNIYIKIGFSEAANRFTNGGLDVASDEAEPYDNTAGTTIGFANGSVDANTVSGDAYETCYNNIRAVNVFFKNVDRAPLKAATKVEAKAEARFLRAWYYSILLKHYGGVPLIGDTVYDYKDKIEARRASYADCVNYILAECDKAGQDLPVLQSALLFGRASKSACLALKMRVLLYAASPLFNDPSPGASTPLGIASAAQKPLVGYENYDPNRWKLAEDAAKAVMDLGTFSLVVDNATAPGYGFQYLFTQRQNSEYIWQLMKDQGNRELEGIYLPPSRAGRGGGYPYQELVDAFPMANGLAITNPASNYNANNPYQGRDPRLAYTILRDQSTWITNASLSQIPINIYTVDGKGVGVDAIYAGTKTGYYGRKMLDPAAVPNSFNGTNRCIPLIRYAEVLLSYAEAANEFEGPSKAYPIVERIRQRAGLNPYTLPAGLSKDGMRKAIQDERRLELAFEGHRFWDVRRWKLGDATQTLQMTGLEVQRNAAGVLQAYKLIDVRKHGFSPALYLWPLPAGEVAKSSLTLQNPGY